MIVGMFIVTWVGALAFWRFGHVEERWSAKLVDDSQKTVHELTASGSSQIA